MLGRESDERAPLGLLEDTFSAQLSASVAPEVKAKRPPGRPIAASTRPRATSIAAAASRPQRDGMCGVANFSSNHGRIAASHFGCNGRGRLIVEVDHAARWRVAIRRHSEREGVDLALAGAGPKLMRRKSAGHFRRDAIAARTPRCPSSCPTSRRCRPRRRCPQGRTGRAARRSRHPATTPAPMVGRRGLPSPDDDTTGLPHVPRRGAHGARTPSFHVIRPGRHAAAKSQRARRVLRAAAIALSCPPTGSSAAGP